MQEAHRHTLSVYHPWYNGQTKVLNMWLEIYLRCFCGEDASKWSKCLTKVECWYNTSFHLAIHITPYEALYDKPPPLHTPYLFGELTFTNFDNTFHYKKYFYNYSSTTRAQLRMKQQDDLHKSDMTIEVGGSVYFKTQPYRQQTIFTHSHHMLSDKYYDLFQIIKKVRR